MRFRLRLAQWLVVGPSADPLYTVLCVAADLFPVVKDDRAWITVAANAAGLMGLCAESSKRSFVLEQRSTGRGTTRRTATTHHSHRSAVFRMWWLCGEVALSAWYLAFNRSRLRCSCELVDFSSPKCLFPLRTKLLACFTGAFFSAVFLLSLPANRFV